MTEAHVTIVLNAALFFGLWWLVFIELKSYRLNLTRQKLFKVRDELFEYVATGEMDFDAKAYGLMRSTLNGMIRFTHKLSFIQFITIIIADEKIQGGKSSSDFNDQMSKALAELPSNAQARILSARDKMHIIILKHIVFSSVFLSLLFYVAIVLQISQFLAHSLLTGKAGEEHWSTIDAEAKKFQYDREACLHSR